MSPESDAADDEAADSLSAEEEGAAGAGVAAGLFITAEVVRFSSGFFIIGFAIMATLGPLPVLMPLLLATGAEDDDDEIAADEPLLLPLSCNRLLALKLKVSSFELEAREDVDVDADSSGATVGVSLLTSDDADAIDGLARTSFAKASGVLAVISQNGVASFFSSVAVLVADNGAISTLQMLAVWAIDAWYIFAGRGSQWTEV